MAEQRFQFGDYSTADILLWLVSTDRAEYRRVRFDLHFQVLKKSEFYETLLSERWRSDKPPIEIEISTTHSTQIYRKCIKLMYDSYEGKCLCFSDVEEALAILPVASEILFHQCLEESMRYLNAVRWSTKQEVKLRALLLSLEINTLPDLAATLGMNPHHGGLEMLKQSLQKMLSTISEGSYGDGKYIEEYIAAQYIEEYIAAHFEANASFAETCRYALLKEFNANVECVKSQKCKASDKCAIPKFFSALSWIVNVIQRCDREMFETVLKMFCEDAELPNAVICSTRHFYAARCSPESSNDPLVGLIDRFLTALGNGRIITSTPFRISFLTNWVPILVKLNDTTTGGYMVDVAEKLHRKIVDVAETLPVLDQKHIYIIWKSAILTKHGTARSGTATIQDWGKKVDETIFRHNNFFDMTDSMH